LILFFSVIVMLRDILIVVKCQGECVEAGPTFRVEQLALPVASSGVAFMF